MKKILILLLFPVLTNCQIISAWSLNGDATDRIGANNGVAHNMTYVAGKQNQAGSFNGTSGYIAVKGNSFWFGTTSWTVSCIVNYSATGTILTTMNAAFHYGWFCYINSIDNEIIVATYSATANACYKRSKNIFTANKPHYLTIIYIQDLVTLNNNDFNIYIDGNLADSTANPVRTNLPAVGIDSLRIGKRPITGIPWYITGYIDEVIIEQRAWTAAEIKQKYIYYFFGMGLAPEFYKKLFEFYLG